MSGEPEDAKAIEGEVVREEGPPRGDGSRATALALLDVPRLVVSVEEAVKVVQDRRLFMRAVMKRGVHYGAIPGTGGKDTLLKPGAESLLSNVGARTKFADIETVRDFRGADTGGEPFIYYRIKCLVVKYVAPNPEGYIVLAEGEGSCHSWEGKYRWRTSVRKCPTCNTAAIIRGKPQYAPRKDGKTDPAYSEGGWLCFKKKGGCGAEFADADESITKQPLGQVRNEEVLDLDNTILKMAKKRALIDATLLATGCSDIFTQDAGDEAGEERDERDEELAPKPESPRVDKETVDLVAHLFKTQPPESKRAGAAWMVEHHYGDRQGEAKGSGWRRFAEKATLAEAEELVKALGAAIPSPIETFDPDLIGAEAGR